MHVERSVLLLLPLVLGIAATAGQAGSSGHGQSQLERGRYLVVVGGCNDCHTPGFAESGGTMPEEKWLMGSPMGWKGPWGTTYASNLRLFFQEKSRDEWVEYAHQADLRPPMPDWVLHAMTDEDLAAIHAFVRQLGSAGKPAPEFVPPGEEPKGPYIAWPQPPKGD